MQFYKMNGYRLLYFSTNHQAGLDRQTHNVNTVVYTINVAKTAYSAEFVSIKRQNGSPCRQNTVSVRTGFVIIFVILYNAAPGRLPLVAFVHWGIAITRYKCKYLCKLSARLIVKIYSLQRLRFSESYKP